jgi:hypothetical protein
VTENFRTTKTAAVKTTRARSARRPAPIEISRVDERVLARAKELAGGDASRFKLVPARSRRYPTAFGIAVVVLNQRATS